MRGRVHALHACVDAQNPMALWVPPSAAQPRPKHSERDPNLRALLIIHPQAQEENISRPASVQLL